MSTVLQILCSPYSLQVGGLHSTECVLVWQFFAENCMKIKEIGLGRMSLVPPTKWETRLVM